jgi:hypothetical protein
MSELQQTAPPAPDPLHPGRELPDPEPDPIPREPDPVPPAPPDPEPEPILPG